MATAKKRSPVKWARAKYSKPILRKVRRKK